MEYRILHDGDDLQIGITTSASYQRKPRLFDFNSAVTEVELFRFLHSSRNVSIFALRVQDLMRGFGLEDFGHYSMSRMADVLDTFGTYSDEFMDEYAREQFHLDDLMLLQAASIAPRRPDFVFQEKINRFVESAPIYTDQLLINLEIAKFLRSHKILDACSFFIPCESPDYKGIFHISAPNMSPENFQEKVLQHMPQLQILAKVVDQVGQKKFHTHFHNSRTNPRIPIAPRPLELLAILQKDCTLNEAAEVLNMSISTANQHIAAAKKAFRTTTTHGTIVAAQREGLLERV